MSLLRYTLPWSLKSMHAFSQTYHKKSILTWPKSYTARPCHSEISDHHYILQHYLNLTMSKIERSIYCSTRDPNPGICSKLLIHFNIRVEKLGQQHQSLLPRPNSKITSCLPSTSHLKGSKEIWTGWEGIRTWVSLWCSRLSLHLQSCEPVNSVAERDTIVTQWDTVVVERDTIVLGLRDEGRRGLVVVWRFFL